MEVHEAANIFPMEIETIDELAQDIAEHGQKIPIETLDGKILDGRRRHTACLRVGIVPTFKALDPKTVRDPVAYVLSLNLHRRHLDESQRAMVAGRVEEIYASAAKERQKRKPASSVPVNLPEQKTEAREAAGKALGVSGKSVDFAKKVLNEGTPELVRAVDRGEVAVSTAAVIASAPAKKQKQLVESRDNKAIIAEAKRIKQQEAEERRERRRQELLAKAAAAPVESETDWELIQGECAHQLSKLEAGSCRLLFADPPYNIGIDYGEGSKADRQSDSSYLAWCEKWMKQAHRLLAPDGSFWVMICDEYAGEYAVTLKSVGFTIRNWIKWYESFGVNTANKFNRTSRHIFYCVKDPNRFVFNPEAVSRPSARQAKYGDSRANPDGKIWDDVWGIEPPLPRVVGTSRERIPDFPTQLPIALLEAVVGCASDPGDLVCDPFNGSGTTGVACINLGRRYIGIEKSEQFLEAAKVRLRAAETDKARRRAS